MSLDRVNQPTLELLLQRPAALGKVFFVDGTGGLDTQEGTDPAYPLLTMTAAIAKCTAGKGDIVIVLRNSPSAPPATETFPVALNKAGMLLTGLYSRGLLSDSGFAADAADTACLQVGANYVTVENLYLGCSGNSLTGVIDGDVAVAYWAFTVRNCMFNIQGSSKYGLSGVSGIGPYLLVEDNVFGRDKGTAWFTTAAIAILDNATGGIIRRNQVAGGAIGIYIDGRAVGIRILDNDIQMYTDGAGVGITISAGSGQGCYINRNHASFGMGADGQNPYLDQHGDDSNTWGLNWAQEAVQLPA